MCSRKFWIFFIFLLISLINVTFLSPQKSTCRTNWILPNTTLAQRVYIPLLVSSRDNIPSEQESFYELHFNHQKLIIKRFQLVAECLIQESYTVHLFSNMSSTTQLQPEILHCKKSTTFYEVVPNSISYFGYFSEDWNLGVISSCHISKESSIGLKLVLISCDFFVFNENSDWKNVEEFANVYNDTFADLHELRIDYGEWQTYIGGKIVHGPGEVNPICNIFREILPRKEKSRSILTWIIFGSCFGGFLLLNLYWKVVHRMNRKRVVPIR